MSIATILRKGIGTLLNSAVVEVLVEDTDIEKYLSPLREHFSFTAHEIAEAFQQSYGYALSAISLGLVSPENRKNFWQSLFQSQVNQDIANRIEIEYLQAFTQQQNLTAPEEVRAFSALASSQCQALAKLSIFQADNRKFSESELASFVTSAETASMTDLILAEIQAHCDEPVINLLKFKDLLSNALLFFLHEHLRKEPRFRDTLSALQREGLMVDVRAIKASIQSTEAQLNQAFNQRRFDEVATLSQNLQRLERIDSVAQTHYGQFIEFTNNFAEWAQFTTVQLDTVLTTLSNVQLKVKDTGLEPFIKFQIWLNISKL